MAITRPSDALEARAATDKALTSLLLGLGGVALLVGGVGIANVMIISVLERRGATFELRADGTFRCHLDGAEVTDADEAETIARIVLTLREEIRVVLLGRRVLH